MAHRAGGGDNGMLGKQVHVITQGRDKGLCERTWYIKPLYDGTALYIPNIGSAWVGT